jgi:hypothetical protein
MTIKQTIFLILFTLEKLEKKIKTAVMNIFIQSFSVWIFDTRLLNILSVDLRKS